MCCCENNDVRVKPNQVEWEDTLHFKKVEALCRAINRW